MDRRRGHDRSSARRVKDPPGPNDGALDAGPDDGALGVALGAGPDVEPDDAGPDAARGSTGSGERYRAARSLSGSEASPPSFATQLVS